MAKEDLFEEGKQPAAEKPAVNADKLKALRAANGQDREKLRKRFDHEIGRRKCRKYRK